jgi:hypothetical protein
MEVLIVSGLGGLAIAAFWMLRHLWQAAGIHQSARDLERAVWRGLALLAWLCPTAFATGFTWYVTQQQGDFQDWYDLHIQPALDDIITPDTSAPGG